MKITSILCATAATVAGAAVLLPACGSHEQSIDAASAYAELRKAVEDCATTRTACLTSAGTDTAAQAACEAAFSSCTASAGKDAEQRLAQAAAQCADQARDCRAQSADKKSCQSAIGQKTTIR